MLFRDDAYLQEAHAKVVDVTDAGVVLDRSQFYPTGGGQPGDTGRLDWDGGSCVIVDARKGQGQQVMLIPDAGAAWPQVGTEVTQTLDWARRHAHMRVHTALHLLSVVIPLGVTGGQIGAEKGRLDFDMAEPPEDKAALEDALNALIARDLTVSEQWITDAELEANPGLVKTMSVQPPKGAGRVRLVRIGTGKEQIDLQPCGGTHVARTAEIGRVRIGKIENKGRNNRRVNLHLDA
ncbi:Ser-tRNA(Ala) deacylase / Gly-tRNA(Ala) deacylase [Litoreibacter arenae DSM 19593]|uniref:Alanine--tRNA ligase n=1 Tax=Litoreibacter arenae DSM 19593 TaxID=1123360 RepID=S9QFN3_9RHOB|nr:Ser-tRNA(Ala) deacylase / Gly-tRNA(Ala) deacylase [Litoreibacter arenae DSM 19593]